MPQSIEDMQTVLDAVVQQGTDGAADGAIREPGTHGDSWRIAVILPPGINLTSEMMTIWNDVIDRMHRVGISVTEEPAPDLLGDAAVDAYNVIGSSEAWDVHKEWIEQ